MLKHLIALVLPRRFFPQLIDPLPPWLYALLLVTTAVAGAIVVHVAFEKPVTRWLQKRVAAMPRKPRAANRRGFDETSFEGVQSRPPVKD